MDGWIRYILEKERYIQFQQSFDLFSIVFVTPVSHKSQWMANLFDPGSLQQIQSQLLAIEAFRLKKL